MHSNLQPQKNENHELETTASRQNPKQQNNYIEYASQLKTNEKVKQMQSAAWNLLVKEVKNATKKPRTPPTTKTANGNPITQQHTKLRALKL